MEPTCENCRHWKKTTARSQEGHCTRYAPRTLIVDHTIQLAKYAMWPMTKDWEGCGEHAPKENP